MGRIWSPDSQSVHDELHETLGLVLTRVRDEVADVSLVEGYRNQAQQSAMYDAERSQVVWPNGKHNRRPSWAVDFHPYPYPQEEKKLWGALGYVAGAAIQIAKGEGLILRWGGDWNRNGDVTDQNFFDLFHLEIVEIISDTQSTLCTALGSGLTART